MHFVVVSLSEGIVSRRLQMPIHPRIYRALSGVLREFGPGVRYRISLQPRWDPYRHAYLGSIRAVSRVGSHLRYFPCTKDLAERLGYLATIPRISDLPASGEEYPGVPAPIDTRALKGVFLATLLLSSLSPAIISLSTGPVTRPRGQTPTMTQVTEEGSVTALEPEVTDGDEEQVFKDQSPPRTNPAARNKDAGGGSPGADPVTTAPPASSVGSPSLRTTETISALPPGYVALTFDDGPSKYTREIVEILAEHGIEATFFFVGQHVSADKQAVRFAYDQGMSVGNHSWSHRCASTLDSEQLRREIRQTGKLIEQITGYRTTLYRPPYGNITPALERNLRDDGMTTVMWNRDPRDWKAATKHDILEYFHAIPGSGGIYIMHETAQTVAALPYIIAHLEEQGLDFVSFDHNPRHDVMEKADP